MQSSSLCSSHSLNGEKNGEDGHAVYNALIVCVDLTISSKATWREVWKPEEFYSIEEKDLYDFVKPTSHGEANALRLEVKALESDIQLIHGALARRDCDKAMARKNIYQGAFHQ